MQIAFLGAGKMATAIAAGLIKQELFRPEQILACDKVPEARKAFSEKTGASCHDDPAAVVDTAEAVILAVKPQDAEQLFQNLNLSNKLLISIAAGLPIATLQAWSGTDRIIRVMPNTPAMVNKGASALAASPAADDHDRKLAREIFDAIGIACEVSEDKLDAVTALSGSGPAFLFRYVEAMIKAAAELGLDEQQAQDLLVQTIAGAAEMLQQKLGSPAELREAVTSKGGTTAAGLASLDQDDFDKVIANCLKAAYERSLELGGK